MCRWSQCFSAVLGQGLATLLKHLSRSVVLVVLPISVASITCSSEPSLLSSRSISEEVVEVADARLHEADLFLQKRTDRSTMLLTLKPQATVVAAVHDGRVGWVHFGLPIGLHHQQLVIEDRFVRQ